MEFPSPVIHENQPGFTLSLSPVLLKDNHNVVMCYEFIYIHTQHI